MSLQIMYDTVWKALNEKSAVEISDILNEKKLPSELYPEFLKKVMIDIFKDDFCLTKLKVLLKSGLSSRFLKENNLFHLFMKNVPWDRHDAQKIAELLLGSGVSINELDSNLFLPLHYAVFYQNISMVSFLIKNESDLRTKWHPVLHFTCKFINDDSINIIHLLLKNGAKINDKNSAGLTALHFACLYHNKKILWFLIHNGADMNAEDKNGRTPFFLLNSLKENYTVCLHIMIKKLAILSFKKMSVSEKNMGFVLNNPTSMKFFNECIEELIELSSIKFYNNISYFIVLNMSKNMKKLANLTENKEFAFKFQENLLFCFYKEDLEYLILTATQLKNRSLIVYSRLYLIFRPILPEIAIEKLAENLEVKDLPLE